MSPIPFLTGRLVARARRERGFTIVEMLVAVTIMMLVVGGVFAVFNPAQGAFQTQPEVSDMQQRLRVGVSAMTEELLMAGAGSYRGAIKGSLTNIMAPILPYRAGTTTPDSAQGTFFRSDAVTVMYIDTDAAESSLAVAMAGASGDITVAIGAGCPNGDQLCGFQAGDRVLIFDEAGGFDTFSVTGVNAGSHTLQHSADTLRKAYGAGARVAEVAMHTFSLRTDTGTDTYQLMHFDGYRTDLPLVDNVVGLQFEYFGDPAVPAIVHDPSDPEGPWTTYGPKPPPIGVDNAADSWPAGENCAFMVSAGRQVSRITSLGSGSLVPLSQSELTDGPWCPDAASPNRYDIGLARIRKVRVTLRVQTGQKALRGPAGTLFTRAGLGKDGTRFLPDQEIRFDVSPRNINLSR